MKNQVMDGLEEAKGITATGLKLGTFVIPFAAGLSLGLPQVSNDQLAAVALVAFAIGMGWYWLSRK